MSSITHITSLAQLNGILSKDKNKVSVIDFHASWCGPCHAMAPTFEKLSRDYGRQITFLKCDVDAVREVSKSFKVSAMPTFVFLRGTDKIDQIRGADRRGLENMVQAYATGSATSSGSFYGTGHTLNGKAVSGDTSAAFKAGANAGVEKVANLDPQIRVLLGLLGAYLVFWYLTS